MATQVTTPTPVKNWVPENYQLESYVLTNVDGDSYVLSLNATDERSQAFAEQELSERYALGFAYAARIVATPLPEENQFWIETELTSSFAVPNNPPVIQKILKAIEAIAIAKVAQLGYPADKVITWLANVKTSAEIVGDIPVTIH